MQLSLFSAVVLLCYGLAFVAGQQKCSQSSATAPMMYNGKNCATTTNYNDGTMGACGCGVNSASFEWQNVDYTAAGQ